MAAPTKMGGELATIRAHLRLPPEAEALVASHATAADAFEALAAAGLLDVAARVAAHALPAREAVWWGCMCAAHTEPASLAEADRAAGAAAQEWVRRPGDGLRRAAWDAAQRTAIDTPEAWCATAVFWSGDSLAPAELPKVAPAPHLPGTAIAAAVALAAVRDLPARAAARLERFLASAREIASGGAGRLAPEAEG